MRKLVTFLLVIPVVIAFILVLIMVSFDKELNGFLDYFYAMLLGALASVGIYMGTKASSDNPTSKEN